MSGRELSLAVVGVAFLNKDGSNRQFEVAMCSPGERVYLVPEPKNPVDPSAVAVISERGIQIGYLSAERCGWIGGKIAQGMDMRAVFQEAGRTNAVIRVNLGGEEPTLPHPRSSAPPPSGDDFYPDYIPPDDWEA
ncbi:hypothetical protein CLG96_10880 [Sphingomonas oleivorans]|uniref:HIRAN domain-containing protein n=1 Tax=Sphingomonas oleivorans TaxID=1735121 RepID=A0A2T5FXT0_9SPHN|nr:HIRAN domain-containing protein [Sphingomonas oleivorans]PTQ10884.1 hypothetical protein CLG96_10880 [Sphingomonas oleivorans]